MTAPDVKPAGQKQRKPKKPPRRNYSEQCDLIFSRLVRRPGVCSINGCGATTQLQCCHLFSRRYRAVRWVFTNAWVCCARHHQFYTAHPIEWDELMRARLGPDGYAELRWTALYGEKPDVKVLLAELKELEKAA